MSTGQASIPATAPSGRIHVLPAGTVNRIAAGEVVERPCAVVKEMVENALDAGAKHITIGVENAGITLIRIEDDGIGMAASELPVAVERHATSKLHVGEDGNVDLLRIGTLGFRGEALPSIGAVSRLRIVSRRAEDDGASCLCVAGGTLSGPDPASWPGQSRSGTLVEVRDLFYATPARLKFLKSERAEMNAVTDTVRRLAMSRPDVAFVLSAGARVLMRLPAADGDDKTRRLIRLEAVMGRQFSENAIPVDVEKDGVRISGYAGVPTLNQGMPRHQYLFVNNRPVRDKMLTGVVRAAYQDFLARDRHPLVAMFIDINPLLVDVNVHPAKAEVRFQHAATLRGLCIGALRHSLASAGHRASTTIATAALGAMRPVHAGSPAAPTGTTGPIGAERQPISGLPLDGGPRAQPPCAEPALPPGESVLPSPAAPAGTEPDPAPAGLSGAAFLGAARAQLHETYIISQTDDGLVIVDQHAAHERLIYEKMKKAMAGTGVRRQALLIPEVVELGDDADILSARAGEFLEMGLEIEAFGKGCVVVRATPALFGEMDVKGLVRDLADELANDDMSIALAEKFTDIMGNMACRSAIKAGRRLSGEEMNALLREMEATKHSGQCNHGRPTYIALKLADIEKLFDRR